VPARVVAPPHRAPAVLGLGYATEIGRAGLDYAFDVLGARAVVSCTVRHNSRSVAVMRRLGMAYAGEIRSAGSVEDQAGIQADAPFAVFVALSDG
jgi:RimJ/RimL family protein N-acetyltransferase